MSDKSANRTCDPSVISYVQAWITSDSEIVTDKVCASKDTDHSRWTARAPPTSSAQPVDNRPVVGGRLAVPAFSQVPPRQGQGVPLRRFPAPVRKEKCEGREAEKISGAVGALECGSLLPLSVGASLLADPREVSGSGQQAGLKKGGSKLPHSKARHAYSQRTGRGAGGIHWAGLFSISFRIPGISKTARLLMAAALLRKRAKLEGSRSFSTMGVIRPKSRTTSPTCFSRTQSAL